MSTQRGKESFNGKNYFRKAIEQWIVGDINLGELDKHIKTKKIKEKGTSMIEYAGILVLIALCAIGVLGASSLKDKNTARDASEYSLPFVLSTAEPTTIPLDSQPSTPSHLQNCATVLGAELGESNFVKAVQSLGPDPNVSTDTPFVRLYSTSINKPAATASTIEFDTNPAVQEALYKSVYAVSKVCEVFQGSSAPTKLSNSHRLVLNNSRVEGFSPRQDRSIATPRAYRGFGRPNG